MANIQLSISRESKSRAEQAIYDIACSLNENWYLWMNRDLNFTVNHADIHREADCILFHKKHGMLIIECKDGIIASRYDSSENGQIWTQNGHKMNKAPALQAKTLTSPLYEFFNAQLLNINDKAARVRIQWAVCFADMENAENIPTNELPVSRLLLKSDLQNVTTFETRVKEILYTKEISFGGRSFPNDVLKEDSFSKLIRFLGSYDEPSLPELFDVENRARILPTMIQEAIMESTIRNKKILIEGVPGSGKSILALWEAKRLAKLRLKTAFVCYNELLADTFAKNIENENLTDFIEVHNFAKWCQKYTLLAKIKGVPRKEPKEQEAKNFYYNEQLPEAFEKALTELKLSQKADKRFFDALIIDEGQDLKDSWIDSTSLLLKDKDSGIVRFFCDPRQKLYSERNYSESLFLKNFATLVLSRGFRSTKKILEWIRITTGIAIPAYKETPAGKAPEIKLYKNPEEQTHLLEECIQKLEKKKIRRQDILVVSLRSKKNSALQNLDALKYHWTETGEHKLSENSINVVSAHRIKGLDAEVVILTDMEKNKNNPGEPHHKSNVILVAATRAKSKLIVLRQK